LLQRDEKNCLDVKIVDFGLSAVFSIATGKGATEKAGTLTYMAPEQVSNGNYSKKVDLWACGIIMWKLLTGGDHPLFTKGDSQQSFFEKLQYFPMYSYNWKFPSRFSKLARDLFVKLCSYPASERYDAR
jgi:serine/threonine protein kinase